MKAIQTMCLLLLLLALAPACRADDGFASVTCSGDVAKALVGKKLSSEPDSAVEGRHKNLALKDLGGDEISDDIFLSVWTICGNDYMLTLKRALVVDVLKMPAHSGTDKEFDGDCKKGATAVPGVFVGILVDQPGADPLPAKTTWKLNDKTGKFTPMPADGLSCSRSGIIFPDDKKK